MLNYPHDNYNQLETFIKLHYNKSDQRYCYIKKKSISMVINYLGYNLLTRNEAKGDIKVYYYIQ